MIIEAQMFKIEKENKQKPFCQRLIIAVIGASSLMITFTCVFYAQYTLCNESVCMQRKGLLTRCLREFHSEELWVSIEVICFWLYMIAIMCFIL